MWVDVILLLFLFYWWDTGICIFDQDQVQGQEGWILAESFFYIFADWDKFKVH